MPKSLMMLLPLLTNKRARSRSRGGALLGTTMRIRIDWKLMTAKERR
jgi:hypothetical protein